MSGSTALIIIGMCLIGFGLYWQWVLFNKKDFLDKWERMLNKKEAELLEKSETKTKTGGIE